MSAFETTEIHIMAEDIDAFGRLSARALRPEVIERAGDHDAQKQFVETVALACLCGAEGLAMRLRVLGDEVADFRRAHKMPMAARPDKTPRSDRSQLRPVDGGKNE